MHSSTAVLPQRDDSEVTPFWAKQVLYDLVNHAQYLAGTSSLTQQSGVLEGTAEAAAMPTRLIRVALYIFAKEQ